jgi:hypothetical protein
MFRVDIQEMNKGLEHSESRVKAFPNNCSQRAYWLTRVKLYNEAIAILYLLERSYKLQVSFLKRLLRRDKEARLGFSLIKQSYLNSLYSKYYSEVESEGSSSSEVA